MGDLIRRSDAIEAVMSKPAWHGSEGSWFHSDDIKNAINDIPAVEPKKVCIGQIHFDDEKLHEIVDEAMKKLKEEIEPKQGEWIPCSERLPSEEERKEWIDNNLDGIGYLYPCLVTRYSSINPDRTKNNPYVAKHYFDGEDFVNGGEEVCSEYILAWMPLPEPYMKGADDE